jgi:hypothetical protein
LAYPPLAFIADNFRRRPPFCTACYFRSQPVRIKAQQAAGRLEPEQDNTKQNAAAA